MTDPLWWRDHPPYVRQKVFVQANEALWRPDPVELPSEELTHQVCFVFLIFELDRRLGVHEVARRHPAAGPCHEAERCEGVYRTPLLYIQLVEEAGGVDEVEGV